MTMPPPMSQLHECSNTMCLVIPSLLNTLNRSAKVNMLFYVSCGQNTEADLSASLVREPFLLAVLVG